MKIIPTICFCSLISLSLLTSEVWAACDNCVPINGKNVKVKEVGIVVGDYHYIITEDNKKVQIQDGGVRKAEIALALHLPLHINSKYNNYSLIFE